MIYFSLVYSHLQYAIGAWGSATKNSLHRLNTTNSRIIKTICWRSCRCHATPLCGQLNLLKVDDIYQLEITKLMHNFHSNRIPGTFDRLFTAVNSVHTHETRIYTSGQYFCHPVCSKYGKDPSSSKAQKTGSKYRVTQKNTDITKNRITSKILFRLTQNFSYIRSSLCSKHLQSFKSVLQKLFVSLALKNVLQMSSAALQAHLDPAGKVLDDSPAFLPCHVWRWQPRQCTSQSVMDFADSAQGVCYPRRCCS